MPERWSGHEFLEPTKKLKNPMLLGKFLQGTSYKRIMQFICDLQ